MQELAQTCSAQAMFSLIIGIKFRSFQTNTLYSISCQLSYIMDFVICQRYNILNTSIIVEHITLFYNLSDQFFKTDFGHEEDHNQKRDYSRRSFTNNSTQLLELFLVAQKSRDVHKSTTVYNFYFLSTFKITFHTIVSILINSFSALHVNNSQQQQQKKNVGNVIFHICIYNNANQKIVY